MAVNLTWHSFMEQVWGIRLRCLTNCTCCETSELELFHIQSEPHTDLCEHQERPYISNIPCTHRQLGSTMTSISYPGEKRITHRQQVCTQGYKELCSNPQAVNCFLFQHLLPLQRGHVRLVKTSARWNLYSFISQLFDHRGEVAHRCWAAICNDV